MFSGIIETTGIIKNILTSAGCKHFTCMPHMLFNDVKIGDSIAINGVCLTVTHFTADSFAITAVPETLRLTNLDKLSINDTINLERSLKADSRIGGHHVQGHVDGMGEMLELKSDNSSAMLAKISLPSNLAKYVVAKGYITLDGMSITVIDAQPEWFTVTFIPHTQEVTTTKNYVQGSWINIEVDIMGKYIEKLMGAYK